MSEDGTEQLYGRILIALKQYDTKHCEIQAELDAIKACVREYLEAEDGEHYDSPRVSAAYQKLQEALK